MTWTAWLCGLWFGIGGLCVWAAMTAIAWFEGRSRGVRDKRRGGRIDRADRQAAVRTRGRL